MNGTTLAALGLLVVLAASLVACNGDTQATTGAISSPTAAASAEVSSSPPPSEASVPVPIAGQFVSTGTPQTARSSPIALRLPDGRVLVAGGGTVSPGSVLDTSEVFDPVTGRFADAGRLTEPRTAHAGALLRDGRVLIIGGVGPGYTDQPLASAEVYDPRTGTSSAFGSMHVPRWSHGAALLADGRVLVAGGGSGVDEATRAAHAEATAELFDPSTGRFESTGSMQHARVGVTLTTLDDGRVLVSGDGPLEIYDPESGTFRSLPEEPLGLRPTATLLSDGRVLFAGGSDREQLRAGPPNSHGGGPATRAITIFDPVSERLTVVGEMLSPREDHAAVRLVDGRVLLSGGAQDAHHDEPILAEAEIFDPATGASTGTGAMLERRFAHRMTLLDDGTVLVVGVISSPSKVLAERYRPPN